MRTVASKLISEPTNVTSCIQSEPKTPGMGQYETWDKGFVLQLYGSNKD